MFAPSYHTRLLTFMFATALAGQVGCVALNIPSQRFHDPSDHGGVLGDWKQELGHFGAPGSESYYEQTTDCIDGGPLDFDPLDPTLDEQGNQRQPEIPWPRYHPVPTRPVFGG